MQKSKLTSEHPPIINLTEFARVLGQQTDFQEILRLVAHKSASILKADLALVLMLNPESRNTIKTIFRDGRSQINKQFRAIHINVGGWIIKHQLSFYSPDIKKDNRFSAGLFQDVAVKAVLGTPLVSEGIVIGALILIYQNDNFIPDRGRVSVLEDIAAISAP